MVTYDRRSLNTSIINIKCTVKGNKIRSQNTSYCLIEVVTKAGLNCILTKSCPPYTPMIIIVPTIPISYVITSLITVTETTLYYTNLNIMPTNCFHISRSRSMFSTISLENNSTIMSEKLYDADEIQGK